MKIVKDPVFLSPAHPVAKPKADPKGPILSAFRITYDMSRTINLETVRVAGPTTYPEASSLQRLARHAVLFSTDLTSGFELVPIVEDKRHLFAWDAGKFAVASERLCMGYSSAPAVFASRVAECFREFDEVTQFVDDLAVGAPSWEALVEVLRRFLARCAERRLVLSPKKSSVGQHITFLGRDLSGLPDGSTTWTFSRRYTAALEKIGVPVNCGQLLSFLSLANFLRLGIPDLGRLLAPLQAFLNAAMKGLPQRSKAAGSKIPVASVGWSAKHVAAFKAVRKALVEAPTMRFPTEGRVRAVATDASCAGWGAVLTECEEEDLKLPFAKQRHFLLGAASGIWNAQEQGRATCDQEALALVLALQRFESWLSRAETVYVFTDHRTLSFIFGTRASTRTTSIRLDKYATYLRGWNLVVVWTSGESNTAADFLSRPELSGEAEPSPTAVMDGRVAAALVPVGPGTHVVAAAVKSAGGAPRRAPTNQWFDPSFRLKVLKTAIDLPPPRVFRRWQDACRAEGVEAKVSFDKGPSDAPLRIGGRVWVPATEKPHGFHWALLAAMHDGWACHRSRTEMKKVAKRELHWEDAEAAITGYVDGCLACVRNMAGQPQVLPWGEHEVATHVGEILSIDFLTMGVESRPAERSRHTFKYAMVIHDQLSNHLSVTATDNLTAETAGTHLLQYWARFGHRCRLLKCDQGPHYAGDLFRTLTTRLMVTTQFSVAYVPHSNGEAEAAVGRIKRALRHLLSELRAEADAWPWVLPIAEAACNGAASVRLGGRCPLELVVGAKPKTVLDTLVMPSKKGKSQVVGPLSAEKLAKLGQQLQDELARLHKKTATLRDLIVKKEHARWARRHATEVPQWLPGTLVLRLLPLSRRKSSVHGRWTGPFRVTQVVSKHLYKIQALGGDQTEIVAHVTRLRYFSAAGLDVTDELVDQSLFEAEAWPVDAVVGHEEAKDGTTLVRVQWSGFPDRLDQTLEPVSALAPQVPGLLRRYAGSLPKSQKTKLLKEIELYAK